MTFRSLVLASLIATCAAQDLATIVQALNGLGTTAFAGLIPTLNQSATGQALFQRLLSGGNFTLFIPNNQAITQVPADVTSNGDTLADIVSYHVLAGNFSDAAGKLVSQPLPNGVIVGRTALNSSSFVELEGNRSQVLVWGTNPDGSIKILNQPRNTTVQNSTTVGTFAVNVVDSVLSPPAPFSQALAAGNAATPSLSADGVFAVLNNTSVPGPDGNNVSFTNYLDGTALRGFTFFVPNNAALQAAQSALTTLQGNATALQIVLGNHLVNGSTLYSTTLANTTSASGEPLTFVTNSTGTFVSSGNATAMVVHTNVLAKNGVIHVIDGVLANTESDPSAASSAFNQATSTAVQTSTETGPIASPTSSGGSNGNGNGGNSGSNGAITLVNGESAPFVLSFIVVTILSALIL